VYRLWAPVGCARASRRSRDASTELERSALRTVREPRKGRRVGPSAALGDVLGQVMKNRSICRRCHRLRVVNEARYCEGCDERLRADERPRDTRAAPFVSTPTIVTVSGEAHSTSDPEAVMEKTK
jgi:hypothetical protein